MARELLKWALPAMRDLGHAGWLCTFNVKQQLQMPSAKARADGTMR
jgi:hypothetical protein